MMHPAQRARMGQIQQQRRQQASHANTRRAVDAVRALYDRVDDYLELPEDPAEWTLEDYEDERALVRRRLVPIVGRLNKSARLMRRMATTIQQLREEVASQEAQPVAVEALGNAGWTRTPLSYNIAVETAPGTRAGIIDLGGGIKIVVPLPQPIIDQHAPKKVTRTIEKLAVRALTSGKNVTSPWTEYL